MEIKLFIFGVFGIVVFLVCSVRFFRTCRRLHLYIQQVPAYHVSLHMKMMKKANGYKPFLYDYNFDACEFMRLRNQPIAKIIWNMIKDVSTVNHTRPYVVLQTVSDIHHIHIPCLSEDYLILGDWYFYDKLQFKTNVYFTFV